MGRPRQPIELVIANGKKHLTKSEIEDRRSKEVPTLTDSIEPPDYLTKTQKAEFNDISEKLQKLKIMSETDVDALARYILSRDVYISLSKKIRSPRGAERS